MGLICKIPKKGGLINCDNCQGIRLSPRNPVDLVWDQAPQWAKKGKTNRRAKRAERKSGEQKRVASLADFFSPPSIFFLFPQCGDWSQATVDPVLILEDADFAYDLAAL